ncbi:IS4 family transposase [Azospirillum sp. sgz302134]
MPHHNTVFHDVLKLVPWSRWECLCAEHGVDARARGFSGKAHLTAMLYGQLAGASSLREITCALASHAGSLYHLGAGVPKRSTLAEANRCRPSAPFTKLLAELMARAHRRLRRDLGECVYLIDSTSVRLSEASAGWARFSAGVCGAKVHVIHDPGADSPIYAQVSASRVNDITAAHAMPVEAGATYVFDLGYYDYAWWAALHEAGCRIVTRFKTNTPLRATEDRPVPQGGAILSEIMSVKVVEIGRWSCAWSIRAPLPRVER